MVKDEDTAWHLEPAHGNQFFISSKSCDMRITSSIDHPFTHQNQKACEKWIIEPTAGTIGHFTVRSQEHGKYLGSSEDRKLIVSDCQQHWIIFQSPHGGVFIESVEHGGRLSCDENGHTYTTDSKDGWETYCLEPIMPVTISAKKIWSLVGIGSLSIVSAVAAPFAVMGIIGAMGFGAGGIVGGSMAAGMMSAEAIAAGGGVIAGGAVATLQSIGAVGLGVAYTSAAVAAGAAAGAGLAGVVVVTSLNLANAPEGIKSDDYAKHLPLCSWRMWS